MRFGFRWVLTICGLYLLLTVLSGCETVKGAVKGFSKDWESMKKIDKWMQENLW